MLRNYILPGLFLFGLTGCVVAGDAQETNDFTRISSEGLYRVSIDSHLKPLELGRLHAWTVTISSPDGTPVKDAEIMVGGGMPIHNHGFPTQPRVTREMEDGVYLVEGVKFSMHGPWVIFLDITANEQTDSVAFDIDL